MGCGSEEREKENKEGSGTHTERRGKVEGTLLILQTNTNDYTAADSMVERGRDAQEGREHREG